jgi:hypothetical protein
MRLVYIKIVPRQGARNIALTCTLGTYVIRMVQDRVQWRALVLAVFLLKSSATTVLILVI